MTRLIRTLFLAVMGVLLTVPPAAGQNLPQHNLESFNPLDLPDPSSYRAADGKPGERYWQNEADYRIDVTLDTAKSRLSGEQTIAYTNNSPETIERLWVQLEQNYFKPDSRAAKVVSSGARFSGFFEGAGYTLSSVEVEHAGKTYTPDYSVEGTRMVIPLEEALVGRGGVLEINLEWSFEIPEFGADRHGILEVDQGTIYQLAQWYPRMYVHDDVNGWNPLPYLGQGEYYLEYGTFSVNITVPRDMIVAATGTLLNPGEVLTRTQRRRLDETRDSDGTVTIIEKDDVGDPDTRPDGEGPLTWRYRAEEVRDFSWTASQAFIWDASMADAGADHEVLAQSFYPEEGLGTDDNPGWEKSTEYVEHAVEFYSDFLSPYPYDSAINVAGTVAGMEYPQIMFCDVESRGRDLLGVTDHEFGHTWFPMVVGSDERRWAWMDEGLNTFMNQYSEDAYYDENNKQSLQRASKIIGQRFAPSPFSDQPIMTYSDHVRDRALGFLAYFKPANGLMLLRDYVVGPERFDAAFRAFFDRWAYKHPQPADFFRTIEDVTGEDLDWFWRSWFYETDTVDHAVANVATGNTTTVTLEQRGELMLPITVEMTYQDGTSEQRRIPTEAFFTKDTHTITLTDRSLKTVQIDPEQLLPDTMPDNNTWTAASDTSEQSSSQGDGEQ